jgi:hypothetical protein
MECFMGYKHENEVLGSISYPHRHEGSPNGFLKLEYYETSFRVMS